MLENISMEIEDIRKKKFPGIKSWKCKFVSRKYAFELPLPYGEYKFLKIKYDASMPALPPNLSGNTFDCLFGTNQSMLEAFILKQKIKGPCWLTIKNAVKVKDFNKTWCKLEISVDNPKNVFASIDDLNREAPSLSGMCFAFKTCRSA